MLSHVASIAGPNRTRNVREKSWEEDWGINKHSGEYLSIISMAKVLFNCAPPPLSAYRGLDDPVRAMNVSSIASPVAQSKTPKLCLSRLVLSVRLCLPLSVIPLPLSFPSGRIKSQMGIAMQVHGENDVYVRLDTLCAFSPPSKSGKLP